MKNIKWGMIGCGDVTEIKNGPGLYLAVNSELVGVTNRTLSKAENWIERHKHGKLFKNTEELLKCDDIDIVYIASTPDSHKDLALKCALSGKHCLIEKPLATSYEDGLVIKKAFENAGKKAFVAFYRRSMDKFVKIKEIIKTNKLGKIQAVNISRYTKSVSSKDEWRINPKISGGGIFSETDIHILDFLDFCFGEAEKFNFTKTNNSITNLTNTVSLNIQFKNNINTSGLWIYNSDYVLDRFEIIGDRGILSTEFFIKDSPIIIKYGEKYEQIEIKDSEHVGLNMTQAIVNELNGLGKFESTVDSALRTLKIADNIVKSV